MIEFDRDGDEEKRTHEILFCHPDTEGAPRTPGHLLELGGCTRPWVCWRTAGYGVLKTSGAIALV